MTRSDLRAETLTLSKLAAKLGLFDATMMVMGGIVGAGIFINPYVVALQLHTPLLILGAWILGGVVAMLGAFVYAELAARRPRTSRRIAAAIDVLRCRRRSPTRLSRTAPPNLALVKIAASLGRMTRGRDRHSRLVSSAACSDSAELCSSCSERPPTRMSIAMPCM